MKYEAELPRSSSPVIVEHNLGIKDVHFKIFNAEGLWVIIADEGPDGYELRKNEIIFHQGNDYAGLRIVVTE